MYWLFMSFWPHMIFISWKCLSHKNQVRHFTLYETQRHMGFPAPLPYLVLWLFFFFFFSPIWSLFFYHIFAWLSVSFPWFSAEILLAEVVWSRTSQCKISRTRILMQFFSSNIKKKPFKGMLNFRLLSLIQAYPYRFVHA